MTSDPGGAPAASEEAREPAAPASRRGSAPGGIPFKFLIPAVVALDILAVDARAAFPQGRPARRGLRLPRLLHQERDRVPAAGVVLDLAPSTAPAVGADDLLPPEHQLHDPDDVDRHGPHPASGLPGHAPDEAGARPACRTPWSGPTSSARDFAVGIGGERARRYYPIFAAFFLFILFSNWSGLVPPVGKIEQLRAPTSDVNITIGLALTSFVLFQGEGFRRLGVRGYLGKFFPIGEFRHGIGAGHAGDVRRASSNSSSSS